MRGLTWIRIAAGAVTSAFLVSCAEVPTSTTAVPTPTPAGYWNGDGVTGSPKIVISISEQHAYFYKGKTLVGESTVSTGKPGFSTPPGNYAVLSKDKDHVSTVFGDYVDDSGNVVKSNIDSRKDSRPPGSHYDGARMPYAMFFRGGYAMHQGYVPPYAASHGCIRLPAGMAEPFFENAPVGTPVVVKQEAVKHPVVAPALMPLPTVPAPAVVRTNTPAAIRPGPVRTTASAPTPIPVRSPALVRSTVPSPTPAPVRVRSTTAPAPMYNTVRPAAVPVRSPSPAAVRSSSVRPTVAVPTPSPAAVRSTVPGPTPVPVYSRGPSSLHPTPTPVPSRTRAPVRYPPPTPTPTPTPIRSSLRPRAM